MATKVPAGLKRIKPQQKQKTEAAVYVEGAVCGGQKWGNFILHLIKI